MITASVLVGAFTNCMITATGGPGLGGVFASLVQ
jgi:hypothetical protein